MLDIEMKMATCKIKCGEEYGTGSLITPKIVLTAGHCVDDAADGKSEVSVTFDFKGKPLVLKARVLALDSNLDIALVELDKECEIRPINLSAILPIDGKRFYSYGWPVSKLTMGHRLEGNIVQTFDSPKLGSDIEISIDEPLSLNDYQGLSGATLVCDGACTGVIRISIEKTIGVISVSRLYVFLNDHGITVETNEESSKGQYLASREVFCEQFDKFVSTQSSSYFFIKGAHGIGKSTFCKTYSPLVPSLEHFGTYSFTPTKGAKNAIQLAQPQEFFNWLNMQVSMFITGSPGRKETADYSELINKTDQLFLQLSKTFSSRGKIGVLFIDGLDEVERQDSEVLNKLIGLLPLQLPLGLVIVFSAPNYEQFATRMGSRLSSDSCISMPSLSYISAQEFCYRVLITECANSKTVSLICERAQGHPLYLRYLIDLVNSGTSNDELKGLPLIEGSIRKYYDLLWLKLKEDNDAVNLLAIVVRLRWGIPVSNFTEILNSNEQAVLLSTLGRIQHLLLNLNETTVYHSSFSDFLIEKTQLREQDIQIRLAEYCEKQKQKRYGLLNLIYHGLKVEEFDKGCLVASCDQKWIDDCVYQGVEPDTLLEDLHDVLKMTTELGSLVETVRILLLSQRIKFRYDTLFAQSADLTAKALISIDKEKEVLQHVSRYGQLIIPLEEALNVALKLINSNHHEEALGLLNIVETHLTEALEQVFNESALSYREFLDIYNLQLQQYLLKVRAGDDSSRSVLANFQYYWMKTIDKNSKDKESSKLIRSEMLTYMQAASMCLISSYISISQIRKFYSGSLSEMAEPIVFSVPLYQGLCEIYGVNYDKGLLEQAFSDIEILVSEAWDERMKVHLSIIDCFISLGASRDIVVALGEVARDEPIQIAFIADDNVSIDESALYHGMAEWRLKAFLEPEFPCPELVQLSPNTWINGVDSICRSIAWCGGAARRFKKAGDTTGLETVWKVLYQGIFSQLNFRLTQRVQWEDAYGLPENIFPLIYQSITILITDVFPDKIYDLLKFIEDQFGAQCGIYSEGFRSVLNKVLNCVTSKSLEIEVEDQAFQLMELWREYVTSNLKNRYELIPDLLEIVPLFTRLDATDEAIKTYRLVLAFSMGPSWYKEDQFGLSIVALESLSHTSTLESGVLSQIAGLLDAAGGEMTFQRFVRYAKRDFIGALCSREDFASAVNYFIRQTYGTLDQMYQEVTRGGIDRVSELKGTRFPGAALDEQDSILPIVKSAISGADWQLCWALLESFQFGDSRHINNFAEVYGLLIKKVSDDDDSLTMIMNRLEIICESEFESETNRSEFIASIASFIPERHKEVFEAKFTKYLVVPEIEKVTVQTSEESTAELGNGDHELEGENSDSLYLPGTFGYRSSIAEATTALSRANRYLRRRNYSEGQKEIISGLTAIQSGGWPIWTGQVPEVTSGQSLLLETDSSVSDLIKLYSPLILNERYVDNWRIAESLITWLASYSSNDEQVQLLRIASEHTHLMVGDTNEETAGYTVLDEGGGELSQYLVTLFLHVIEHPTWLRREKASEMLLWLSKSYPKFIHLFGAKAFSMDSGIHPDVICGALEQLSTTTQLWDTLFKELDFNFIKQNCKHVGRYSVLMRIARQAEMRESESATEALTILTTRFDNVVDKNKEGNVDLPVWAECIRPNWSRLEKLGLITANVVEQAESLLKDVCSPLSIEVSLELEQLLADAYYGSSKYPSRWSDKVRYAFQVALQGVVNESEYKQIEIIFRQYNPTRLDNLRITNFKSPALQWLHSKEPRPLHGDSIYLDYCERVWFKGQLKLVRLTAYLSDNSENLPLPSGRFLSIDQPSLDKTCLIDTCANVEAFPTNFGSFTPAIPTTNFMRLTGAGNSNLKRSWWKSGRLKETHEGDPLHEGCFLSIDKRALRLPHGFNLIWVFELDLEPIGFISFG